MKNVRIKLSVREAVGAELALKDLILLGKSTPGNAILNLAEALYAAIEEALVLPEPEEADEEYENHRIGELETQIHNMDYYNMQLNADLQTARMKIERLEGELATLKVR